MLATTLSRDTQIQLVESDAIGIVGVGEATIPPIRQFNRFIGLDEREFMKATQATFKLGIEFHNWGAIGDRYIHQFGYVGREIDAIVKLHHWWMVGRLAGGAADYPAWEDMFLAKSAARAGRFALPDPSPQSPLSRYTYAYHFDAHLYGKYLRTIAEARGVKRLEGRISSVRKGSGEDVAEDRIAAVVLDDGRELEADLFIDCSGFRSLLLGGALDEPFDDWSHWLPADRALAVPSARETSSIAPFTKATAHNVGWQWRIPLQHRTGNGHVFASAFGTEGDAEQRLLAALDTPALDTPRLLKFQAGRRRNAWVGNVIGIGLAAGFLEPLESTSIHLVQSALESLIEHFPSRRMDPLMRDRFNLLAAEEWERVRDFIIAHYKVTGRSDSDFWNHVRTMDIPASLAETLEYWEESGFLSVHKGHLFQLGSWSALLLGQGLYPRGVHALANRADPVQIAGQIRAIAAEVDQAAQSLPLHADFISRYCPAPAAD